MDTKDASDLFQPKFDGVLGHGVFGAAASVSHPDQKCHASESQSVHEGPHASPSAAPRRSGWPSYGLVAEPLQPMQVYIPPADGKLIAEISRLHAVIGRYREAWQVTVADLDEIVTGASDALTADDLSDFEQRFLDVTRYYEGGAR
jgi:hypothetical protein